MASPAVDSVGYQLHSESLCEMMRASAKMVENSHVLLLAFLQTVFFQHLFEYCLQLGQALSSDRPDNLHIHSEVGVNDYVPKANHA